jgi:hypothetical protein
MLLLVAFTVASCMVAVLLRTPTAIVSAIACVVALVVNVRMPLPEKLGRFRNENAPFYTAIDTLIRNTRDTDGVRKVSASLCGVIRAHMAADAHGFRLSAIDALSKIAMLATSSKGVAQLAAIRGAQALVERHCVRLGKDVLAGVLVGPLASNVHDEPFDRH